jgi:AraC-like DNA-binding protein
MRKTAKKQFYMHKISNFLNVQKIVTIHYQKPEKNYVSLEEAHNFWELLYADKEEFSVHHGKDVTLVKKGEIFFVKPNQPHFVECKGKEANIFIVSFECRSESIDFFADQKYSVPQDLKYLLQNIMSEALETFHIPEFDPNLNKLELKDNPNLGGEQIIKNSLELLLIYLLRTATNKETQPEFFLSKISSSNALQDEIVCILSEHVYSTITLEEICEKLHYGKTYLCTFFKKKTGMTIYQTYLKLKTDEAKKLIRRNVPFSAITNSLYFDSVSHFSYIFKKYTGMTPGEYKNSIM